MNSNLLDENRAKTKSNATFNMKKVALDNCNWTGKLQVALLFAYISWKKFCWQFQSLFGKSNRDAFLEGKCMNEDMWNFFS